MVARKGLRRNCGHGTRHVSIWKSGGGGIGSCLPRSGFFLTLNAFSFLKQIRYVFRYCRFISIFNLKIFIKPYIMSSTIKFKLSFMMFLEFFIWGAWFVTLGTFLGNTLNASGLEIANVFSTQSWGAIIAPF